MRVIMEEEMKETGTFSFDIKDGEERLAELMLHVSNKCQADPRFGATKLNKILWWSDFLSYAKTGKPITGVEYQRLRNGPVPKRLPPIREKLIGDHDAILKERPIFNKTQKRLIPLREANLNLFTANQIALVDDVISWLWEETATSASKQSHGKAWEIARTKESMPYESICLSDEPITNFDVIRTSELAEKYGWGMVA